MDTRVELLLDELSTHPAGQNLDFAYWRGRFQTLFGEKLDDQSRQSLLQAYAAVLDLVERAVLAQNGETTPFKNARKADWSALCIQEAMQRSGTEVFQPNDLNEIVQREIAAGRMEEGDFAQLTEDAASVLSNGQSDIKPKKGFFRRLFG